MQVLICAALIGTAAALVKPDAVKQPKDASQWPTAEEIQKANANVMKQYSVELEKTNTQIKQQMEKITQGFQNPSQPEAITNVQTNHKKKSLKLEKLADDETGKPAEKKLVDAEDQKPETEKTEKAETPEKKTPLELRIAEQKCDKFVEILENVGNGAAYVGKTYIGGQKMDIIWDTGSDEFVVNSVNSNNLASPCIDMIAMKQHDCYSRTSSKYYSALEQFPKKIRYGSGNTVVLPGIDRVNFIGNKCPNKGVKFMEVIETDIPQLSTHEIDAVGGLGTKNFERATFLTQMGIDRFSFCFLGDNSRPGKLIWNDDKPEDYPEPFKFNTMAIHGTDYWTIQATDFTLTSPGKDSQVVGCKDKSCMCVVDSGTSLITLDEETLKAIEVQLNEFESNTNMTCNDQNLKQFPVIKFYLDGKEHQFHPQDYLMYTDVDELPQYVREVLHFNTMMFPWLKEPESKKECVMMFTPPMGDGLCILGMPFFRNYLVQFDRESRTISTAPHDGECKPAQPSFLQLNAKNHIQMVDPTKLRVSAAYHQLKKQAVEKSTASSSFLH